MTYPYKWQALVFVCSRNSLHRAIPTCTTVQRLWKANAGTLDFRLVRCTFQVVRPKCANPLQLEKSNKKKMKFLEENLLRVTFWSCLDYCNRSYSHWPTLFLAKVVAVLDFLSWQTSKEFNWTSKSQKLDAICPSFWLTFALIQIDSIGQGPTSCRGSG